jgi:photosystem II stability/assembly factor-like uncharacterized protein
LTNLNVTALATDGTNIFAGTNGGGVFLSSNNGTSWAPINTGTSIGCLGSCARRLAEQIFLRGRIVEFFFLQTAVAVGPAINSGLSNTNIFSLLTIGSNIFAGSDGGGVFQSVNNGTTWTANQRGFSFIRNCFFTIR